MDNGRARGVSLGYVQRSDGTQEKVAFSWEETERGSYACTDIHDKDGNPVLLYNGDSLELYSMQETH